jgi:hypothetical protein
MQLLTLGVVGDRVIAGTGRQILGQPFDSVFGTYQLHDEVKFTYNGNCGFLTNPGIKRLLNAEITTLRRLSHFHLSRNYFS